MPSTMSKNKWRENVVVEAMNVHNFEMLSMLIYSQKFNKIELLHRMVAVAAVAESERCCNVVNA